MQWVFGYQVSAAQEKDTRAEEAMGSNPDLANPAVLHNAELARDAAHYLVDKLGMDTKDEEGNRATYQVVCAGDTERPFVQIQIGRE